jgi:DNA primase
MRETPPPFLTADDLQEIRRQTDWPGLLQALGIRLDPRRSKPGDLWAHSPFSEDRKASFHVTDKGWYCFSTAQGGGALELVQQTQGLTCYAAARWLLDNGLSSASPASAGPAVPAKEAAPAPEPYRPIRQDLLPRLTPEHPELFRRGISPATCAYLGCGYLPEGGRSPLSGRIVFQVRGVQAQAEGGLEPVILTHVGRALSEEQEEADGKWHHYKGFLKTLELYNIDKLLLDPEAVAQARATGHILLVEGCFDVAKLVEAGILNAGACFGSHLDESQLPRLQQVAAGTGVGHFRVWFDRDAAGRRAQEQALALINGSGALSASGFDWDVSFPSPARGPVALPETLKDPGDFSAGQLGFLRAQGLI